MQPQTGLVAMTGLQYQYFLIKEKDVVAVLRVMTGINSRCRFVHNTLWVLPAGEESRDNPVDVAQSRCYSLCRNAWTTPWPFYFHRDCATLDEMIYNGRNRGRTVRQRGPNPGPLETHAVTHRP